MQVFPVNIAKFLRTTILKKTLFKEHLRITTSRDIKVSNNTAKWIIVTTPAQIKKKKRNKMLVFITCPLLL